MTPAEAIAAIRRGELPKVLLIAGTESLLASEVVQTARTASLVGGFAGMNDDTFQAGATRVEEVLGLARTMPMMAKRRFILVRDLERWEEKESKTKSDSKKSNVPALDQLAQYAEAPSPETCLVLLAPNLDKRRRLYTAAKKGEWLVSCDTPSRAELPSFIVDRARARSVAIDREVADLIAELSGPELAPVADAVERLCLYVGERKKIEEEDVDTCVVRIRSASVWELVAAVGRRDLKRSLQILEDVFEPQDRGLPLIGILGFATRQLIKFSAARRENLSPPDAAKAAGAPPFKARDLEAQLRGLSPSMLGAWLLYLGRADLELKGGSRRDPKATITQMIIDLCQAE